MIVFSISKINLGLNVVSKRSDGYHNIESIFYPIDLCDIIEILPSKTFQLTVEGNSIDCSLEENLCYKAFCLLKKEFSISDVHIVLFKKIPTGAGLGGGSSNAASVLMALNQMFELHLTKEQLMHYAAQLGSDCPFFVEPQPAFVQGTGTLFTPIRLNLTNYFLVIIKNNIHVSTRWAYSQIHPKQPALSVKDIIQQYPINEWKYYLKNDFEDPVFVHYPQLRELKQWLYEKGALYASMTGSGAAIYGIFSEPLNEPVVGIDFFWQSQLTGFNDTIG